MNTIKFHLNIFNYITANPNAQNTAYEPAINEVTVPVLNRDLCNEWLEMLNVTEGMICAGYAEGGKDGK